MRLDYNILWFEDSEDYVESLKPRLEDFIKEFGFEPEFTIVPNGSDLFELLDNNSFDIILMDFNLDVESGNGGVLINRIRDQEFYIEILFYSAQSGFREHINQHLDGVFFADRDELFEKSKKVINLTIKKSQDINNLRGLVIAESIDIESKMDEMLMSYFRIDDEKDAVFRKIVNPRFNALNFKKKCDLINRICKIKVKCLEKKNNDMGEDRDLKEKISNLKQLKKEIGKIEKEIIDVRNILAHTKEDPEKKNTLVSKINKNKEEIIINDNWCKEKRNDIRRQSENLERLFSYIRENG
jgi:CheY-like chemotaxis protein